MTGSDRGAERRRLLEAMRSDGDSDPPIDDEPAGPRVDRPEPAPDGGTVTLAGPLYHCTACDRTYLEEPAACGGCGGTSFDRRTAD